jgi:hypothetical protein
VVSIASLSSLGRDQDRPQRGSRCIRQSGGLSSNENSALAELPGEPVVRLDESG